jgi:ribonuclease-3
MGEDNTLEAIQSVMEYRFRNMDLLRSALTHSSVAENRLASNERLEFLGDAVLGLVICEELYARYPKYLEGEMTRVKSVVVSRETCARVADQLGLVQYLSLGKGMSGSSDLPSSLAACVYEACVGAIYLDGGLEPARQFILEHMGSQIEAVVAGEHHLNYKSLLQQYAQRVMGGTPQYELQDEKGPDHAKAFEIAVLIRGRRFPSAWGPSKKSAEQRAAYEALRALGQVEDRSPPEEIGEGEDDDSTTSPPQL